MKLPCPLAPQPGSRGARRGSAVLMLLALIALLLVIVAANDGNINSLRRELRVIERAQQRHWQTFPHPTNPPVAPSAPLGAAHE